MSFYVTGIIHSNQSLDYFPDNQPFQFKCHFDKVLSLDGKWEVALCKIDINEKVKKIFFVCSL